MLILSQLLTRRRDASGSLVLLIVSAGFSLATLYLFIVNVALPNIAQDFGSTGLGDLSWVLNAYAIVFAALLVVFGRLADRFPREYGFLYGVNIIEQWTRPAGNGVDIIWNASSWDPYRVILMRTRIEP